MTDKAESYRQLLSPAQSLFAATSEKIANAANLAAPIRHGLPDLNWAGFYFREGVELVPDPFQGVPACGRTLSLRTTSPDRASEKKKGGPIAAQVQGGVISTRKTGREVHIRGRCSP